MSVWRATTRQHLVTFRVRKLLHWQSRVHGGIPEETVTALGHTKVWQTWGYTTFEQCLRDEYGLNETVRRAGVA